MSELQLKQVQVGASKLAVHIAGDPRNPALLLIHGFPDSSTYFRNVIGLLSQRCWIIAPDLPGFGVSEPLQDPTFSRFADVIEPLLDQLGARSYHLYVHDFGAAVALHLATRAPDKVRSLIIQNANAHESGMSDAWSATKSYWRDPTPDRQAEATSHLTFEGVRDQYIGNVPTDIASRIDSRLWEDDWRVMSLPGRLETQRALVFDYRNHVARFAAIAAYLERWQPSALMLWGRHDIFFDLAETLDWMKALARMEAHILDGPHLLLETHATECAELIDRFIARVESSEVAHTL